MVCVTLNVEKKTKKECTEEGTTRCKNGNLEECIDNQWQIIEEDSKECKGKWQKYIPYAAAGAGLMLLVSLVRR